MFTTRFGLGPTSLVAALAFVVGACSAASQATTGGSAASAPAATSSAPPVASTSRLPVQSIDPALPVATAVDPAGTCAGDSQLCTQMDVATWSAIAFTPEIACSGTGTLCRVVASIYGPTHPGIWPLFVLVSGADEYETPNGVDERTSR